MFGLCGREVECWSLPSLDAAESSEASVEAKYPGTGNEKKKGIREALKYQSKDNGQS